MAPKPADASWLLVVLAQQRSGTTALRRTLALGRSVHDFGEVFSDPHDRNPVEIPFLRFRQQRLAHDAELSIPYEENQERLWAEYVARLRESSEKPIGAIDVKYGSWHHLNSVWWAFGDPPSLVKMLRHGRAHIVHVVRANVFAQACSAVIARRRGVYQVKVGRESTLPVIQAAIDPRRLSRRMQRIVEQTEFFRRCFARYERYVELEYEEIFDGERLSAETYERLAELTGEDLDEGAVVPLSKVTPSLADVLRNPDEIIGYFEGSPFESQVMDALAPVESTR